MVHLHRFVCFNIKEEESEGFRCDELAYTPGVGKSAWGMGDCGLFVAAFCQAGSGANSLRVYMLGHSMFFTGHHFLAPMVISWFSILNFREYLGFAI